MISRLTTRAFEIDLSRTNVVLILGALVRGQLIDESPIAPKITLFYASRIHDVKKVEHSQENNFEKIDRAGELVGLV